MSRNIFIIVAVILVLGFGYFWMKQAYTSPMTGQAAVQNQAASGNTVTMQNFSFSPASLKVKASSSVTFVNQDTVGHSATADDGSFDTGLLGTGGSKTVTFTHTGTITYHCSVHPNMKGTIVVE